MRIEEILKHRNFTTWEGYGCEVYSSYKVMNHETKRRYSVLHTYIMGRVYNIPLTVFKRAIKDGSININTYDKALKDYKKQTT